MRKWCVQAFKVVNIRVRMVLASRNISRRADNPVLYRLIFYRIRNYRLGLLSKTFVILLTKI